MLWVCERWIFNSYVEWLQRDYFSIYSIADYRTIIHQMYSMSKYSAARLLPTRLATILIIFLINWASERAFERQYGDMLIVCTWRDWSTKFQAGERGREREVGKCTEFCWAINPRQNNCRRQIFTITGEWIYLNCSGNQIKSEKSEFCSRDDLVRCHTFFLSLTRSRGR